MTKSLTQLLAEADAFVQAAKDTSANSVLENSGQSAILGLLLSAQARLREIARALDVELPHD